MNLIPLRVWAWIAAVLACIALWAALALAWSHHNEAMREEGRAQVRAAWKAAVDQGNKLLADQQAARDAKQQENDHETAIRLARAADDAASARAAADGLRQQLARYVAARRGDPQAQPAAGQRPGEQGSDPLDLLANLLAGSGDALAVLGKYADELHIAGQRCEAGYDAEVTP